jgi:transcription antitermination factor NusG
MEDNNAIIEKIEGLKAWLDEKFNQNDRDHNSIKNKQDHTNGDVKKLKQWKAGLMGGFAVLAIIVGPMGVRNVLQVTGVVEERNTETKISDEQIKNITDDIKREIEEKITEGELEIEIIN